MGKADFYANIPSHTDILSFCSYKSLFSNLGSFRYTCDVCGKKYKYYSCFQEHRDLHAVDGEAAYSPFFVVVRKHIAAVELIKSLHLNHLIMFQVTIHKLVSLCFLFFMGTIDFLCVCVCVCYSCVARIIIFGGPILKRRATLYYA